jgi:hypothetical protein
MRSRASWLAWSLCALCAFLGVLGQILLVVNGDLMVGRMLAWTLVFFLFAAIGALIASRQPGNAVGWILCAVGLYGGIDEFAAQYAVYALVKAPGSLRGGVVIAWLQGWVWAPAFGLLAFLLLLFPNGRLPSRRWRPAAWLSAGASAALALGTALRAGEIAPRRIPEGIANPFGLEGVAGDVVLVLGRAAFLVSSVGLLLAAASMVRRFRRASGDERQQLKWFACAAALMAAAFVVNAVDEFVPALDDLQQAALLGAFASVPIAVGIAVLKHRLYDVDLLINRALVYGTLTAALGLAYWGGVVLFQQILRPFTQASELATIGSTLAVAALFRPARRRVQGYVDRRFYRRRYDAQRTLGALGARLRDEVELESLGTELLALVHGTVQPAHASLWLKPSPPAAERVPLSMTQQGPGAAGLPPSGHAPGPPAQAGPSNRSA